VVDEVTVHHCGVQVCCGSVHGGVARHVGCPCDVRCSASILPCSCVHDVGIVGGHVQGGDCMFSGCGADRDGTANLGGGITFDVAACS
jgi:hypothetical protein